MAQELSALSGAERTTRFREMIEDIDDEYGDEASAKIKEFTIMTSASEMLIAEKFNDALKSVTIRDSRDKVITKKAAIKSRLPANVKLYSSTRNPEKDIPKLESDLEKVRSSITPEAKTNPENVRILENIDILLDAIDETKAYAITGKTRAKRVKIDSFLGGVPLGPISNRDMLYSYWEDVNDKYQKVKDAIESISTDQLMQIFEGNYDKIEGIASFKNKDLSYVIEIDPLSVSVPDAIGQLATYVVSLEQYYNLSREMLESSKRETGEISGDINSQLQDELRTAGQNKDFRGGDLSMLDTSLTSNTDDDISTRQFKADLKTLDPLLYYFWNHPKSGGRKNIISITQKGFEELSEKSATIAEIAGARYSALDIMMSAKVKKDIEAIKDTFSSTRNKFFLPYTIIPYLPNDAKYKGRDNEGDILDFLDAVGNLLYEFTPMVPSKSPRGTLSIEGFTDAPTVEGHKGIPKEVRTAVKDLVQAIEDYYITPSYSGKLPIAQLGFVKSSGGIKITAGAPNIGVNSLEGTAYQTIIANRYNVKKSHIDAIYEYLNSIISGVDKIDMRLTQKGEAAAQALTDIFGGYVEENNNHMAAILAYLYKETDVEIGDKKFAGKKITTREKEYEDGYNSGKPYPLFVLPAYLMRHKTLIERTNMKNSVARLKDLLRRVEYLPVILKALLKAHDVVRELKGLRPVYAFRPLTIEHSEEVINKMYNEFEVDLSHSEVDRIVTEVNSFSNIAKSLGVSEEIVYQVKAQFR
jgi:hypothetical protein